MSIRLTLIHTVPSLADHFEELLAKHSPQTRTHHIVVEPLLRRTIEEGRLSEATVRELAEIVEALEPTDAVMVTCSTLGPAVDALAATGGTPPVLRVDEAMARRAVHKGRRVGVLATLATTLEPTSELVERIGREEGRPIEVESRLCHGAFEAITGGEPERHDDLVREGLTALMSTVDVVVLAQASMARVVDTLSGVTPVPVLSSPTLAVEAFAERFDAIA